MSEPEKPAAPAPQIPPLAIVQPTRVAWLWSIMQTENGPVLTLRIESVNGSQVYFFAPDDARRFGQAAINAATEAMGKRIDIAGPDLLNRLPKMNGQPSDPRRPLGWTN